MNGKERIEAARKHINEREFSYNREFANVWCKDETLFDGKPIKSFVCFANLKHPNYVGPEDISKTADVISKSRGQCGHNAEYLFRLVEFMKGNGLCTQDEYLLRLDTMVRTSIGASEGLTWDDLIGNEQFMKYH